MVAFFLMLVVLFFKINTAIRNKILKMLTERRPFSQPSRLRQTAISLALSSILLTIYAGITVGVFSIAVRLDQRVELLISRSLESTELHDALMLKERAIIMVAHRYAFFERVLYWTMGWHVFEKFPWLGVGPGNTGFFFLAEAPDLAWASYEMREVVYRLTSLPNVKSFWVRLLSETGWLGFSTFVIWLYILWSSSKVTAQSRDGTLRTIALAGQLALAAFIAEGFSIDSYAMPYLWIWLGFSSAAGLIFRSTSFRSGMFLPPEHIGEQRNS
jgi:hypothetical protein